MWETDHGKVRRNTDRVLFLFENGRKKKEKRKKSIVIYNQLFVNERKKKKRKKKKFKNPVNRKINFFRKFGGRRSWRE